MNHTTPAALEAILQTKENKEKGRKEECSAQLSALGCCIEEPANGLQRSL